MISRRRNCNYVYIVEVRFVNGNIANYRLPIDVSLGLDQFIKKFPDEDYKKQLVGSYINVPIIPYLKSKHNKKGSSIIAVGHVLDMYKSYDTKWFWRGTKTTRSQFIIPYNSNKKDLYHNNIRYMQHNFSKLSKAKIRADINRMIYHKRYMMGSIIDAIVKIHCSNKMKGTTSRKKKLWNSYFKKPY